jgi:hypothetical protein
MPLYRKMTPEELAGKTPARKVVMAVIEPSSVMPVQVTKQSTPAAVIEKTRGRPVMSTGDAKKDERNAKQRALMAKKRAAAKLAKKTKR